MQKIIKTENLKVESICCFCWKVKNTKKVFHLSSACASGILKYNELGLKIQKVHLTV